MKRHFFLIGYLLIVPIVCGQIMTQYRNMDPIVMGKLAQMSKVQRNIIDLPPFNMREVIEENAIYEGMTDVPFRFGKGFDVHYTLADGTWRDVSGGRLWSLEFRSVGACSINFILNDLNLGEGAEIYITNLNNSMLYGPVTSEQNSCQKDFLTDIIRGDDVIVYLFEPLSVKGKSNFVIKKVVHGYVDVYSLYGLEDSGYNHNDVACYPDWQTESDAVACMLLSDGTSYCSGSLVMTTDQSFKPYFLTAFHCIDKSDGLNEEDIIAAESSLFKFHYRKKMCGKNILDSSITFNGAIYKAGWAHSDFALLELKSILKSSFKLSWLGWDRSNRLPLCGTGLHHPRGDVQKISFDTDPLGLNTEEINWFFRKSPINSHWIVNYDSGTTEPGSSGSPLFNEAKRVIGQLHGGIDTKVFASRKAYGAFHQSWTGGGTDNTGLKKWLNPTNSTILRTNTRYKDYYIQGDSLINQQREFYTIVNLPNSLRAEWSISSSAFGLTAKTRNSVEVVGLNYDKTATLLAKIYYGDQFIDEIEKNISTPSLEIEGDDYVSCCRPNRNKIKFRPLNSAFCWNVSPDLDIDYQRGDSIGVNTPKSVSGNWWIEAMVYTNGRNYSTKKYLTKFELGSLNVYPIGIDYKEGRKRYSFMANPVSKDGRNVNTMDANYKLNYFWSEKEKASGNGWTPMFGKAVLESGGYTNSLLSPRYCIEIDNPVLPMSVNDNIPTALPQYMVATLPSTRYTGIVSFSIQDDCDNVFTYNYEITNTDRLYYTVPNPVNATLVAYKTQGEREQLVYYGSSLLEPVTFHLYNEQGLVRVLNSNTSEKEVQMDVANLPEGTYYLHIILNHEVVQQQVILIKH